jgi:hypothetical protein
MAEKIDKDIQDEILDPKIRKAVQAARNSRLKAMAGKAKQEKDAMAAKAKQEKDAMAAKAKQEKTKKAYGGKAKMMGGGKVHMKKYAKGGGIRKANYK